MADVMGALGVPTTIEGLLIQLQRRLNEAENRERGMGRGGWELATILLPGATPLDNGFPSWRFLNDGRVELRGRLAVTTPVAGGTKVLRLGGRCAPPGDGANQDAWMSMLAPCSTSGTNPGVYRLDVERFIVTETWVDENGATVTGEVIYADVIAYPPGGKTLTDWIGFDHVIFDPNIYIDTLAPVSATMHNKMFSHGVQRHTDGALVLAGPIPGEFGIAVITYDDGDKVAIIPGMQANPPPPPIGP